METAMQLLLADVKNALNIAEQDEWVSAEKYERMKI